MTSTQKLTSRQTSLIGLLDDIVWANHADQMPSKADLTRGMPTKTRANKYRAIDQLIHLGLVENAPTTSGRQDYRLVATGAGRIEQAHWAADPKCLVARSLS